MVHFSPALRSDANRVSPPFARAPLRASSGTGAPRQFLSRAASNLPTTRPHTPTCPLDSGFQAGATSGRVGSNAVQRTSKARAVLLPQMWPSPPSDQPQALPAKPPTAAPLPAPLPAPWLWPSSPLTAAKDRRALGSKGGLQGGCRLEVNEKGGWGRVTGGTRPQGVARDTGESPSSPGGRAGGRDSRGVGKAGAETDGVQVLNTRTFPRSSLSVPLPPPH